MKGIKINFKVKILTNFISPFKVLVNLDKSFKTKPYIFSKKDQEYVVNFELDKYPEEGREDPCLILHTYLKRESDSTFLRTAIYKLTFYELSIKAQHYTLKVPHEKLMKADILISNFQIEGNFKHKFKPMIKVLTSNMINNNANSVFHYLDNNFDFTHLSKVAIFYRESLLYRMSLLSQLFVNENKTNEMFWESILGYMKSNIDKLKTFKGGEGKKQLKKPRPLDIKTSWVDMITYLVTKGYNYRTDYPRDFYSEPYFNKGGDCIAHYEEIYTIDGLKNVGDLKVGDMVLSYCFETKRSLYKPITKIWEKGLLPIKRVMFGNGTSIDVTEKHPFWVKSKQRSYEKRYLCDIKLNNKKIPIFKKIPHKTILHENSFFKSENFSDISIKSVSDVGFSQTRDFEVEDTHSYVFKNGVIGHNCEDLGLAILHLYSCFVKTEFKNKTLRSMQLEAKLYIPFFTFCVSKQKQFGLGGKSSLSGHVLAIFIKKNSFINRLKNKSLSELMKKDIHDSIPKDFPVLIGEGTSNVKPYIENTKYTGYEGEHFNLIKKLYKVKSRINFKDVSDKIGIRVISDPNSGFYSYFGMLFTNYFYEQFKERTYGFICATHNKRGKDFYGFNFENLINFSPHIKFYPMPKVNENFIKLSKKNNRYQIPLPTFKLNGSKFENGTQGEDFYKFDYNSEFFKKLEKFKVPEITNIIGYSFFSDEDILNEDIRTKLLDMISSNKLKIFYQRQELNYDTSTHFFIYGKEKDQVPYVEVIPASNRFLMEI